MRSMGVGGCIGSRLVPGSHMRTPVALADCPTPREPREDDDPLSGAEQRMAGAEHEAVVAHAAQDRRSSGWTMRVALDRVAEASRRASQRDRVAPAQRVDVAERRAVGRAVARRSPSCRAAPGSGVPAKARALAQVGAASCPRRRRARRSMRAIRSAPDRLAVLRRERASARARRPRPAAGAVARACARASASSSASQLRRPRRSWVRLARSALTGSCQASVARGVGQHEQPGDDQRGAAARRLIAAARTRCRPASPGPRR